MTNKHGKNEQRDEVLKRLLKTPPKPHKPFGKGKTANKADHMPIDDSETAAERGKRISRRE